MVLRKGMKRSLSFEADDTSVSTNSTTSELTPSPPPRRLNRIMSRSRRSSSMRDASLHDLLSLPSLDHEDESQLPSRVSFWTSDPLKACYGIMVAAYLFRCPRLLYAIPAFLLVESVNLLSKWFSFVSRDSHVIVAKQYFKKHWARVTREVKRSEKGGWIRRRQEVVASNFGYRFMTYLTGEFWDQRVQHEQEKHLAQIDARILTLHGAANDDE